MFGQLTRGRHQPSLDTSALLVSLNDLSRGESDTAYIAKRLTIGVERRTLADDLIASLVAMSSDELMSLINRMASRRATIYDMPRHLMLSLAQRFATNPRRGRALHL